MSCNAKCLVDWSACSSLVPGAEELLSLFVKAEGFCQLSRFLISYLHLLGTISQTNILDIQTSAGVPLLIRKNVVLAWFKKNEKEALKNVVISKTGVGWNQFGIKKVGAGFYNLAAPAARLVKG